MRRRTRNFRNAHHPTAIRESAHSTLINEGSEALSCSGIQFLRLTSPRSKSSALLICPACGDPIQRKRMKVVKPFACPNCNRLVRTSASYRRLLYGCCYGVPTLLVLLAALPPALRLGLWIILSFFFATLYIVVVDFVRPPRLVLASEQGDDIQRLNLTG